MNVQTENDNEPEVCNLDISFDLDDEKKCFDKSAHIKYESPVECASQDVGKYYAQTEQINRIVHDHETSEVFLNISFDHTDFEPISTEKKKNQRKKHIQYREVFPYY